MKGFSLLEILITLAIIAIMAGTLLMSGNNKGKQEVQLAAREMAAQLRLLQNDAINGKVADGKIICKANMLFNIAANTYETFYYDQCSSATDQIATNTFTPKKSKLNLGTAPTGSVAFQTPTGKVELDLDGRNGILLQSERDPSQKMTVCVNYAGNIEEIEGENLSCAGVGGCSDDAGKPCSLDSCHNNDGYLDCDGTTCKGSTAKPAVNATLSGWSTCNGTCGVGTQTRTCFGASCGGDATCGGAILSQSCPLPPCPPPPTPHLAWAGWSATTPFGWHAYFYPAVIDINGPVPFGYACGLNYDCSGVACVAGNLYWNVCCSWMGCGVGVVDCIYSCS